jgi:hypothetical protein
MRKLHHVEGVSFDGEVMVLRVDGAEHRFPLSKVSPKLLAASPAEREKYEISPSGYGIHWPTLDEDLSIDGLLGITHQPSFRQNKAAV